MSTPIPALKIKPSKKPAWGRHHLVSTLKTDAICFSETSVYFQRTTWCCNPGKRTLS
jgi:hypothetical protein